MGNALVEMTEDRFMGLGMDKQDSLSLKTKEKRLNKKNE